MNFEAMRETLDDPELQAIARRASLGECLQPTPNVYLLGAKMAPREYAFKIGWTCSYTRARVHDLQLGSPMPLTTALTIPGPKKLETRLHQEFREHAMGREWFRYEGRVIAFFAMCILAATFRRETRAGDGTSAPGTR